MHRLARLGWFGVGMTYGLTVWDNLNGVTLQWGNSPWIGLAVLAVEILAFSGFLLLACTFSWDPLVVENPQPKVRRLALSGLGALFFQFCLGAWLRQTQNGLACPHFPGCLDGFLPIPLSVGSGLAFVHRWWGVMMLGLFVHLGIATAKTQPTLARMARRLLGLSVAEIFFGIGTVMSGLSQHSRTTHAAVGFAIWGILFFIAIRTGAIRGLNSGLQKKS